MLPRFPVGMESGRLPVHALGALQKPEPSLGDPGENVLMAEPSMEQDFDRFRAEGDLRALGRVFDRAAPRLLLVAAHFTRDAASAEDLVQTTFLEAIRSAERFDADGPLLSWLTGILVHHAAKARRRERRKIDRERLSMVRSSPGPREEAEASELAEAVATALDGLPRHYRQVLALRLVHELQPSQIAHTLGCPPDTVKTRLRRGMALLRERLPLGFTLPAALLLAQGRGLAAVRAAVMQSAVARKTVTCSLIPLFSLGGALAMKKVSLIAGSLAALALLCVVGGVGLGHGSFAGSQEESPDTPLQVDATVGVLDVPDEKASERARLTPPSASDIVFLGRCVDAETEAALAGCRISVAHTVDETGRKGVFAGFPKKHLSSFETGRDGRFEIQCPYVAGEVYLVEVTCPDRVGRRARYDEVSPGQRLDFGDLRLGQGPRVTGRVLDQAGHPVAGGLFRLTRDWPVRFDNMPPWNVIDVPVDAFGRFTVGPRLAPGTWNLWWWGADDPFVLKPTIEATSAQQLEIVIPVADDRQTIRGVVVDASGKPIPTRVWVAAQGAGTYGHAWPDQNGAFEVFRRGKYAARAQAPVKLTLKDQPAAWVLADGEILTRWGESHLRVVVQPAAQAIVRPIDARSGSVLQDYQLRLAALDGDSIKPLRKDSVRLPGGETRLCAVPRGTNVVRVEPSDPTLAASVPVRFEACADKVTEVVVELAPKVEIPVELVDGSGKPVPGSEVQLVQAFDESVPTLQELRWLLERTGSLLWCNGGTSLQPIGSGCTGADGRVRLPAAAGGRHWLALLGPGHVPTTFGPVVATDSASPVRVVVERGATLRGQILPVELLARLGTTPAIEAMRPLMNAQLRSFADNRATKLLVRRVEQEQDRRRWQPEVEVALQDDGTFDHSGIPAGCYDVILAGVVPNGLDDGHLLQVTIAKVQLRDGEATELRQDLSRLLPGKLQGRVLINGNPYARQRVDLFAKLEGGHVRASVTLDADGRFETQLMPGTYRVHVACKMPGPAVGRGRGCPENTGYWYSRTRAPVTCGQITEHTFAMRRVSAHVRILTADGKPAPGLCVTIQAKSQPFGWTSWTTDEDGWITIVPAPLDPFALLVLHPRRATGLAAKLPSAARDAWLDTMRVPETGDDVRFERRLPPNWEE